MYKEKTNSKKAFTLIELLIVIAIIGILASVVLVGSNKARLKARTAKSISQLQSINNSIQAYYALNGSYPDSSTGGFWDGFCSNFGDSLGNNWIPALAVTLPVDPRQQDILVCWDSGVGQYLYGSNGSVYKLISHSPESMSVPNSLIDPVRTTWAWGYWSPGGEGI